MNVQEFKTPQRHVLPLLNKMEYAKSEDYLTRLDKEKELIEKRLISLRRARKATLLSIPSCTLRHPLSYFKYGRSQIKVRNIEAEIGELKKRLLFLDAQCKKVIRYRLTY